MSEELKSYAVRITVLEKTYHPQYVERYAADPQGWSPCTHFEVGQQFVTDRQSPWEMPRGFCGWAWADLQKLVYGIARGGQRSFVSCCTDGCRPVIFLLERVD